jgi:hypothetical protein
VKFLVLEESLLISSSSPKEMRGLLATVKKITRVAISCYSDVSKQGVATPCYTDVKKQTYINKNFTGVNF